MGSAMSYDKPQPEAGYPELEDASLYISTMMKFLLRILTSTPC